MHRINNNYFFGGIAQRRARIFVTSCDQNNKGTTVYTFFRPAYMQIHFKLALLFKIVVSRDNVVLVICGLCHMVYTWISIFFSVCVRVCVRMHKYIQTNIDKLTINTGLLLFPMCDDVGLPSDCH